MNIKVHFGVTGKRSRMSILRMNPSQVLTVNRSLLHHCYSLKMTGCSISRPGGDMPLPETQAPLRALSGLLFGSHIRVLSQPICPDQSPDLFHHRQALGYLLYLKRNLRYSSRKAPPSTPSRGSSGSRRIPRETSYELYLLRVWSRTSSWIA